MLLILLKTALLQRASRALTRLNEIVFIIILLQPPVFHAVASQNIYYEQYQYDHLLLTTVAHVSLSDVVVVVVVVEC